MLCAEGIRNQFPRAIHGRNGVLPEGVEAPGIAELVRKKRKHCAQNRRVNRGGSGKIKIVTLHILRIVHRGLD